MPVETISFPAQERPLAQALRRGFARRCPACGQGGLFDGLLKVRDHCTVCGEALHHHRADDAPPYFTIFIIGHILIPLMLFLERRFAPDEWVHLALWIPLTLLMSAYLLPRIKGALVSVQWAKRMHGFGGHQD